jgi:hypothetical protein
MRLKVEKWMTSFLNHMMSAKELEAEGMMVRCLAKPKKPMPTFYKCTMTNPHCAKRPDEILENEDEQIIKFC